MIAMYVADTRATPGGVVIETDALVACRTPRGTVGSNMAIVAGPTTVAGIRAVTDVLYERGAHPFTVWTRAHADAALESELRAAGWLEVYLEPGMTFLPGAAEPRGAAAGHRGPCRRRRRRSGGVCRHRGRRVRRVRHPRGVGPRALRGARLAARAGHPGLPRPRSARPAGGGGRRSTWRHGVGGVGWVGALPDAFGRGYGRAATWAVVREGLARDASFLSLQASQMGAPMYTRMGFTTPTHYRWFLVPG